MQDVIVGVLALAIGALFCFRGYVALRVMIPIWGAFTGFMLGAGIVAGTGDDGFLRTGTAWIVGLVFAVVFSALAYLYYEVSIVLAMASIGFMLGTAIMVAIGVPWSWLIVLVGVIAGVLLAMFAIGADMPGILLLVLSAMAGATAIVAGIMVLTGVIDTKDFSDASVTGRIRDSWWWYLVYVAVLVSGIVVQGRRIEELRTPTRTAWVESGGKELRTAQTEQDTDVSEP